MIKRIGINDKIEEGDIIEICNHSEPLYLYSNGRLFEITPCEYNILNTTDKSERGWVLSTERMNIRRNRR